MKNLKKVLAPTDFLESSKEGLAYAISLAEESKAELIILHVAGPGEQWSSRRAETPFYNREVPLWPVDRELQEAALDLNQFLNGHARQLRRIPSVKRRVESGRISQKIVEVARDEKVSLITMTHQHRKLPMRLLRPGVTEEVTHRAPCPVLWVCVPKTRSWAGGRPIFAPTPSLPMDVRVWLC